MSAAGKAIVKSLSSGQEGEKLNKVVSGIGRVQSHFHLTFWGMPIYSLLIASFQPSSGASKTFLESSSLSVLEGQKLAALYSSK